MIIHEPIFNIKGVEKLYPGAKYVCTSALGSEAEAYDIYFQETPHPEFGNRYFSLSSREGNAMIGNADYIEKLMFAMVLDSKGDLHYSQHRHDYRWIDGHMIDGGRAYTKSNCHVDYYYVKDGKFVYEDFSSKTNFDI